MSPAGKKTIKVANDKCVLCLSCVDMCDYNALRLAEKRILFLDLLCTNCLVCLDVCPYRAIEAVE